MLSSDTGDRIDDVFGDQRLGQRLKQGAPQHRPLVGFLVQSRARSPRSPLRPLSADQEQRLELATPGARASVRSCGGFGLVHVRQQLELAPYFCSGPNGTAASLAHRLAGGNALSWHAHTL
jgi:hypothetical protein